MLVSLLSDAGLDPTACKVPPDCRLAGPNKEGQSINNEKVTYLSKFQSLKSHDYMCSLYYRSGNGMQEDDEMIAESISMCIKDSIFC